MLRCDPLGWPRYFTYNYGFEFLPLKDRTIQFFEMWHSWRTIWTDGRPLPANPDPRWLGYSVGHWEGNTFVVESFGFDERTWLSENYHGKRDHGWPQRCGGGKRSALQNRERRGFPLRGYVIAHHGSRPQFANSCETASSPKRERPSVRTRRDCPKTRHAAALRCGKASPFCSASIR